MSDQTRTSIGVTQLAQLERLDREAVRQDAAVEALESTFSSLENEFAGVKVRLSAVEVEAAGNSNALYKADPSITTRLSLLESKFEDLHEKTERLFKVVLSRLPPRAMNEAREMRETREERGERSFAREERERAREHPAREDHGALVRVTDKGVRVSWHAIGAAWKGIMVGGWSTFLTIKHVLWPLIASYLGH